MLRPLGSTLYYNDWTHNAQSLAHGAVYSTEVCINFEWRWLMFPSLLVVIAAFLLLAMIWIEGHRHQQRPVWKSSILPVLFYGFSDRLSADSCEAVDAEELFARSTDLPVHLNTLHGSVGFIRDNQNAG